MKGEAYEDHTDNRENGYEIQLPQMQLIKLGIDYGHKYIKETYTWG